MIDFSHTAIPVAPANVHYGEQGDYQSCMHYLGHETLWHKCKSFAADVMRGEKTEENLEKHTIQRLTFNPYFDDMMARMDRFLDSVERTVASAR